MNTVTFGTLPIGSTFILHILGSEAYFTKISKTVAESGKIAIGLDDDCRVFPAIGGAEERSKASDRPTCPLREAQHGTDEECPEEDEKPDTRFCGACDSHPCACYQS